MRNIYYLLFTLLLSGNNLFGQVIYVDADATGANNGTSWANAFTNLQSALPLATASNEIWVAQGTYKPDLANRTTSFVLLTGTKLYGGFNGTETLLSQRNPTTNSTTLSGDLLGNDNTNIIHSEATRQDNSYNIIKISTNALNVNVDGFVISGANGNGAPGVTNSGAVVLNAGLSISITTYFTNVIFEKNAAVEAAVFRGFTPAANGSSAVVEFHVTNSIIRYNASGSLASCEFVGTHVNSWGQNSNDRVSGSFRNTLFHNNSSVSGASCITNRVNGGSGNYSPLNIFNCTFTENSGANGYVISMLRATTSKYINVIIHNNGSTSPVSMSNSGPVANTWINCIVNDPIFGSNSDPLFRDASNKDYRFDCSGNSPAIGGGTLSGVTLPATDLAGNSRIVNTIDIGCYEYRSVITVSPASSTVCNGSSVTFSSTNGTGVVWSDGIIEGTPYFPNSTQTVTATGTNENNCLQVVPITLTVPVIADQAVSAAPATICTGGNSTITVANSETGVYYSLVNDVTDAVVTGPIQGTGGALNFNLTGITSSTTYHVTARKYQSTINGAVDLDGVNDYVTAGTSNRSIGNTMTISAKVRTTVNGTSQFIVDKYLSASLGYYLFINATGQASIQGRDVAGALKSSGLSTTIVADNQWHEITGVVRNTGWEIWVDGVLENSGAYSLGGTGLGTGAALLFGAFGTVYSPADIDNVAIWNTALSPAQILANVNTCLVGNEPNLTGYFKFDNGSGTTVTDLSSTAINGTLTNMTAPACWIAGPIDACTEFCERELTQLATVNVSANPAQPTISSSGPTALCSGGSVTLTSSAGTSYLWSTGETTSSITVSTAGSYTVQVTNAAGCQSAASAATVVTVGTLPATPTISASGPTTFCAGGSVTLTSSAGTSYLWSNGATTASINATTSGTYTVQVTNAAGCQSTASAGTTVTVNAAPTTPTISTGGPTTFCAGGSVTLTSSAGTSYLWSNGATTAAINATTAGTYTVQVTNAAGCQSAASAGTTVTVNALPSTPTISAGGPTTFCAGGSVTLTSSAGTSYLWSNGATTASINATTAGTYTVQVTNAAGCQSAASAGTTITVNALPATPTITAGGPTTFCAGGSVTLASSGGTSYLWSNGATTASISTSTSGTYTVQVTNANGCQSAASAGTTITVNALPATPTITAGGPTTFCAGGSVTLTSSTGTNYLWSDGSMSASINPSSSGTYTVQVTNAAGCQSAASAPVTVTVNSLPNAPIISPNGPTTFCSGGTVNLASSAGITYLWSTGATTASIDVITSGSFSVQITGPNGCQSPSSSVTVVTVNPTPTIALGTVSNPTSCTVNDGSIQITGTGTGNLSWTGTASGSMTGVTLPTTISTLSDGTYNITFTSTSGCTSNLLNASLSAPAGPAAPMITAGGATTFCDGGSVTLTSSSGSSYLWSNGETTASIVVSAAGNYSVNITDGSGCSSPASSATTVIVNALPVITSGTVTNPVSCVTNDGSIEVTGTGTGDLSWSGAASGNLTGTTLPVTIPSLGQGNYTIAFTDANGCTSTDLNVTLVAPGAPAAPTVIPDGPTTFCEGGSVTLTATTATSYLWSNGETTQSITVNADGTFSVIITDANGCTSPSSATTTVAVDQTPDLTVSVANNIITANQTGATYQWIDCNNGNQPIAGETGISFTPAANGNYAVIVTSGTCSGTSTCTAISTIGIKEQSLLHLGVQPNPGHQLVRVTASGTIQEVNILSTQGEHVRTEYQATFNVEGLARGIYLLKVTTTEGIGIVRLTVE